MASLNLDLNYFDHTKTMRLEARLGNGADVLPIRLWAYVGRHNPERGCLNMLEAELERICRWWGEKGEMVRAMTEIGFLEKCDGYYQVHDWLDHSGHLATFRKRAVKAARKRWGVNRKSSNATSNAKSESKQCPSSSLLAVPAKQDVVVTARPLSAINSTTKNGTSTPKADVSKETDSSRMTPEEMTAIRLQNMARLKS